MSAVYDVLRPVLADGQRTTVHVVRWPRAEFALRVVNLDPPRALDAVCAERGVREAMIGGFFVPDTGPVIGDLWTGGRPVAGVPVPGGFGPMRASVLAEPDGTVRIARRHELPAAPAGDLLSAGPLLVSDGRPVSADGDVEGFEANVEQHDSGAITQGRFPRAALGVNDTELVGIVADGRRSGVDSGLTISELAQVAAVAGCRFALNLDGGRSATVIHHGHLLNRPYHGPDRPAAEMRPVCSALLFEPR